MIQIREYHSLDLQSLTELMTDLGSPSTVEDMEKRMGLIEGNPFYFTFVAISFLSCLALSITLDT